MCQILTKISKSKIDTEIVYVAIFYGYFDVEGDRCRTDACGCQ